MPNQNRLRRKVLQVAFVENGQMSLDIPRTYDYESLHFRIYGFVQVTTAGIGVLAEAPAQLIKRVEVVADGKNTIVSSPYVMMTNANPFRVRSGTLTPPSSAAIGTYAIGAAGVHDFQIVDGLRPKDSNFRASGLSLLQVKFTFGACKDLFYGAGIVAVPQNIFIEVSTSEMVEYADAKGKITVPKALKKVSYLDQTITASNANLQIKLPSGNQMRGVIIRTEVDGQPTDGILNNATLQSGVDVRLQVSGPGVKETNKLDYGQAINTGVYVLDLMSGGAQTGAKLADAWDLSANNAEPVLTLDVSTVASLTGGAGTNKITVVPVEFIPVPQPANAA